MFKIKKSNIFILISLITVLSILSGALGWIFQFVFVGLVFLIAGLLLPFNNQKWFVNYASLVLPFFLIYSLVPLVKLYYHVYPIIFISLFASAVGIYLRTIFRLKGFYSKIVVLTAFNLLFAFFCYIFIINFYHFYFNNSHRPEKSISIKDIKVKRLDNSKEISIGDIKSKVLVLNFWNITCGVCIEELPEFYRFSKSFSNDEVLFYSVHINYKGRQDSIALKLLKGMNMANNCLSIDTIYTNQLSIKSTPITIILDSNKNEVFRGTLYNNPLILDKSLRDIIISNLK